MFNQIVVDIDKKLTKVSCYYGYNYTNTSADYVFWVPTKSLDEFGHVPGDVIRRRIKQGYGINQGHFAYVTRSIK